MLCICNALSKIECPNNISSFLNLILRTETFYITASELIVLDTERLWLLYCPLLGQGGRLCGTRCMQMRHDKFEMIFFSGEALISI